MSVTSAFNCFCPLLGFFFSIHILISCKCSARPPTPVPTEVQHAPCCPGKDVRWHEKLQPEDVRACCDAQLVGSLLHLYCREANNLNLLEGKQLQSNNLKTTRFTFALPLRETLCVTKAVINERQTVFLYWLYIVSKVVMAKWRSNCGLRLFAFDRHTQKTQPWSSVW